MGTNTLKTNTLFFLAMFNNAKLLYIIFKQWKMKVSMRLQPQIVSNNWAFSVLYIELETLINHGNYLRFLPIYKNKFD